MQTRATRIPSKLLPLWGYDLLPESKHRIQFQFLHLHQPKQSKHFLHQSILLLVPFLAYSIEIPYLIPEIREAGFEPATFDSLCRHATICATLCLFLFSKNKIVIKLFLEEFIEIFINLIQSKRFELLFMSHKIGPEPIASSNSATIVCYKKEQPILSMKISIQKIKN